MLFFGLPNPLQDLASILVTAIDKVIYKLLTGSYMVFNVICKLDLFNGNEAGKEIYDSFTQRFYAIMGVIMIFIMSYYLLMYIIDPDKQSKGNKSSTMIRDIIVSIVMVIIAPLIFRYMAMFQGHVLADGTIVSLVTGNKTIGDPASSLSMITLMSSYHPDNKFYNDFVTTDKDGNISLTDACGDGDEDSCEIWYKDMSKWYDIALSNANNNKNGTGGYDSSGTDYILKDTSLAKDIDDGGITYMWGLSTLSGILVVWIILSYCIQVALRAIKLGVLQMIAPIPILLRPFRKSWYDNWFKEIGMTYIDVFVRIGVISGVVFLCSLIPLFIHSLFTGI